MKAAAMPDQESLSLKYEFNSRLADQFGYLLLLGLLVELIFAFLIEKPPLERYSTLVADAFIVMGVWGELHFAHRARVAGDAVQADAGARIAEANRDTLAAQLELERFRKARREIMRGHDSEIADALRPFSGTPFDMGLPQGDGEAADFAWDLEPILVAAGWQHVDWTGSNISLQQGSRPISGSVAASNVEIHLHPSVREMLRPAATALVAALIELDIAAAEVGFNASSQTHTAMHILIGSKR